MKLITRLFFKSLSPAGRASRGEFWLGLGIFGLLLGAAWWWQSGLTPEDLYYRVNKPLAQLAVAYGIVSLVFLVIRRGHDLESSALESYYPLLRGKGGRAADFLFYCELFTTPGKDGPNRFGPPPGIKADDPRLQRPRAILLPPQTSIPPKTPPKQMEETLSSDK